MGSQLGPGQALTVNQQLQAATRPLGLILQADGNLVLYKDGSQALWATATNGMAATQAVMQADGNFVVRAAKKVLWSSKTAGHPGAGLVLQDDGNLVVYDTGGRPLWSSGTVTDWPAAPGDRLHATDALYPGAQLQAASRPLTLTLQSDGNLVLRKNGSQALWATATNGKTATEAVMQEDGNFVVNGPKKALWSTKTSGHPGASLVLQDDGNLVVYDTGGHALWSSGSVTDWPAPAGDRMYATDALYPGAGLTATARPLSLVLQTDGNLVVYRSGVPVWASGTNGKPAGVAVMQEDGNFVVYAPAGPLWASGTNGHPGAWLVLQNDGNMVVHDPQGNSLWASGTVIWPPAGPRAILWPPDALTPGQELDAPSQPYKLVLQQDGNLVLYENGLALWATGTNGKTVTQAVMQADGNLVLYGPAGALWATNTAGHPGARLVLQDDGNLVVYDIGRRPLWSSHTVTHQRDLGLAMQHQQQTNWCWSAVATSVSHFYNAASSWTQCALAGAELGLSTCCRDGSSAGCNADGYLDRALSRTGNLSSWASGSVAMGTLEGEVNAGRPLGVRIGWNGGGGHFVVLDGFVDGGRRYVDVEDPWYGPSTIGYDAFRTAYQGSGSWTDTYYTRS